MIYKKISLKLQSSAQIIKVMNSSCQSMPNKTITQTDLSLSIRPNTTINKPLKQKSQRKTSHLQPYQSKQYNNIIQNANNQLQQYLFNLDQHLKRVIEKRQASYLSAFENHIEFVQKELKKIKQSYEQSKLYEKTVSLQQVIIRLQRQCEIFRNEAMRYFQLLQQKQQQLKTAQRQSSNLHKQLQISQFTKKKLIQKLKLKISQEEMMVIDEDVGKEYRMFQRSRVKSSTKHKGGGEKEYNIDNTKFRKTLMQFDLRNSSDYFKQQPTTGKSARSYLTHGSTADDAGRKSILYNTNLKGNRDWRLNDIENKKTFNRTHHQRFHSQTKLNNYLTLQVSEQRKKQQGKVEVIDDYLKQQLVSMLKEIVQEKILQEQKNNAVQKNASRLQFNFNSEQSVNDFIHFLFPNPVKIEETTHLLQTPQQKELTFQQNQTFLAEFISPQSKRLKTQNNLLNSSIYSIQKGQKGIKAKQSMLYSTKHKIIAISKKQSTLKNKVITAQWTDLQIHKKKPQQKQQNQNNSDTKKQKI